MYRLPRYDQIVNSVRVEEEDNSLIGNVKIITPTETYTIPRKNFTKVATSEFGIAFIKEKKDEMNWSHPEKIIEDFVINLLKNKGTNFKFKFPEGTVEERIHVIEELGKLGLKSYFETTTLGDNWSKIIKLKSYYNDVLNNDYLCTKLSEIWVRIFNKALELNIYSGELEITNNGKIAINGKDITKDILSLNGKNDDFIDDSNLLINFCLYCDIEKYWEKVYNGIVEMLISNDEEYQWKNKILEFGPICNSNNNKCCYQSTVHRHFKFYLVGYINHFIN